VARKGIRSAGWWCATPTGGARCARAVGGRGAHREGRSGGRVRQALSALVAPTLTEEGCLGYELFESAAAPGTFVTQERWRGQSDLDAHLQTEHVQAALGAAGEALAAAPAIHPLVPVP
jgi:quinol monooxygenase YgiN